MPAVSGRKLINLRYKFFRWGVVMPAVSLVSASIRTATIFKKEYWFELNDRWIEILMERLSRWIARGRRKENTYVPN